MEKESMKKNGGKVSN